MRYVTALIVAGMAAALVTALPADAKTRGCGHLTISGAKLPVRITKGNTRCTTARVALRKFIPSNPNKAGRQRFFLAGREWYCFSAHGDALLKKGEVAHCNTPGPKFAIIVKLYSPGH